MTWGSAGHWSARGQRVVDQLGAAPAGPAAAARPRSTRGPRRGCGRCRCPRPPAPVGAGWHASTTSTLADRARARSTDAGCRCRCPSTAPGGVGGVDQDAHGGLTGPRVPSSRRRSSGAPPTAAHLHLAEAEFDQQLATASGACTDAGDRRAGRRTARRRAARSATRPCDGVVRSSRPRGTSTRRTSDSQRAVSATCSITSLAHTSSNELSSSGSGPSMPSEPEIELGVALRARARRRPRATSTPTDIDARRGEHGRELAVAATEVERALAGAGLGAAETRAGARSPEARAARAAACHRSS